MKRPKEASNESMSTLQRKLHGFTNLAIVPDYSRGAVCLMLVPITKRL